MLLPSIRMVGNLRFLDSQPVDLPQSRYSSPVRDFELPDWLPNVGVVGFLFDFGSRRGKHRVNCQFSTHNNF